MNHKRTQNYVDSNVQGALLKRIVLHWLSFFAVAAITIIMIQAILSSAEGASLSQRIVQEAKEFTVVGLILISIFPAFLLDTVRFSNRFVGPVGRLRKFLRQLGEQGDTSRVQFRGDDFWGEMADEFNAVAELVESKQNEIDRLKTQLKNAGVAARS